MKVSVVIPAYNEEKIIERCLSALTNQTVMPDEIIIVDNNCRDKTIEIAKKFPVKIVREKQQGISYARNAGFNAANHEIIGRIDADTTVFPNWTEELKLGFASENTVAVTGQAYFRGLPFPKFTEATHTLFFYHLLSKVHGHYLTFGSNMGLRKSAWQKIKRQVIMDNHEVHEDLDLSIWLAKIGRIEFLPNLRAGISNRRLLNIPSGWEYMYRYGKMLSRLYLTHTYEVVNREVEPPSNSTKNS